MLYLLGLFTLLGMGGLGLWLAWDVQDRSLMDWTGLEWTDAITQTWQGLLYGTIAGLNALWLIHHRWLAQPRDVFTQLLGQFKIGPAEMVFISICAGVGEELLFRAGIQPYLGVWTTAIIFVALHGYLDPRDWKVSLYGVLMVVISAGLGYLYVQSGIIAAAVAHTIIDIILFFAIKYGPKEIAQ
jgi:membrane protease YdiL (CAAX protease family)